MAYGLQRPTLSVREMVEAGWARRDAGGRVIECRAPNGAPRREYPVTMAPRGRKESEMATQPQQQTPAPRAAAPAEWAQHDADLENGFERSAWYRGEPRPSADARCCKEGQGGEYCPKCMDEPGFGARSEEF